MEIEISVIIHICFPVRFEILDEIPSIQKRDFSIINNLGKGRQNIRYTKAYGKRGLFLEI